jgi:EmrB/QacA subfamily drug resistance transporter
VTARRLRLTLLAACCAQFMILLDNTIVNVALPSIQRELGVTPGGLEWTINAYVLALASLILVGGTLGDRYGRKRVFTAGLVLFTAFSAACALSTTEAMLVTFRALQGAGAALLAPLALSILVDAFPPERRSWAIGMWAGVAGIGFGGGPIVGGLLIDAFDWSAIFWVNVPMGVIGVVLTLAGVRESRDPGARRLDLPGAALVSSGLFCLTFALVETNHTAWSSPEVAGLLGASAALLAAFLLHESRRRDPMLPLGFFRRRVFSVANGTYALLYAGFASALFYVTLYFQNVKGWSALETGLSWMTMNGPFLSVSPFAGRLQSRFGARRIVVVGTFLGGLGVLGFALLGPGSSFALAVPSYVLVGFGFGLAVPAISAVAMGAISSEQAGVASGVLNSFRQVGAAVGLAAIGSVSAAIVARAWDDEIAVLPPASRSTAQGVLEQVTGGESQVVSERLGSDAARSATDAFVSGYRSAMLVAGGLILLSCAVAFAGTRARKDEKRAAPLEARLVPEEAAAVGEPGPGA